MRHYISRHFPRILYFHSDRTGILTEPILAGILHGAGDVRCELCVPEGEPLRGMSPGHEPTFGGLLSSIRSRPRTRRRESPPSAVGSSDGPTFQGPELGQGPPAICFAAQAWPRCRGTPASCFPVSVLIRFAAQASPISAGLPSGWWPSTVGAARRISTSRVKREER